MAARARVRAEGRHRHDRRRRGLPVRIAVRIRHQPRARAAAGSGLPSARGAAARDGRTARRCSASTTGSAASAQGFVADLLVVNGNPLENLRVMNPYGADLMSLQRPDHRQLLGRGEAGRSERQAGARRRHRVDDQGRHPVPRADADEGSQGHGHEGARRASADDGEWPAPLRPGCRRAGELKLDFAAMMALAALVVSALSFYRSYLYTKHQLDVTVTEVSYVTERGQPVHDDRVLERRQSRRGRPARRARAVGTPQRQGRRKNGFRCPIAFTRTFR